MIVYVLNVNSGVVHQSVDGRSHESCNLDDIVNKEVSTVDPIPTDYDIYYRRVPGHKKLLFIRRCKRCGRASDVQHSN